MSTDIQVAAPPRLARASKAGRFDQVSIALHWLTLLLVAAQFTTAWLVSAGGDGAAGLLTVHRSTGVIVWLTVAGRLLWRHGFADLPPFPASMPRLQQAVAKANEYALYLLLLVQPMTGLANTLLRGRPFGLFLWRVPLVVADKPLSHLFHTVHELGGWTLLALIGLHAGAALFHGVALRDGVLQRMLPWTAK
ncbi:MAG: cytochrome b [Phenylobacterium sp.]